MTEVLSMRKGGIFVLAAVALAVLADKESDKYTTRWDYINVDDILASERLLKNYMKCLLGEGSCTPDAADLKKLLPDALETDCSKCSNKQKENADKVIHFFIDHKPLEWTSLEEKYDPNGEYRERYEASKKEKKGE